MGWIIEFIGARWGGGETSINPLWQYRTDLSERGGGARDRRLALVLDGRAGCLPARGPARLWLLLYPSNLSCCICIVSSFYLIQQTSYLTYHKFVTFHEIGSRCDFKNVSQLDGIKKKRGTFYLIIYMTLHCISCVLLYYLIFFVYIFF